MKGFKFLVLGNIFAKLFGVFRELIIILEYGYSQEINNYFSLIAILSVITFFSNTSVLNSIAFPVWLKNKNIIIRINNKTITLLIITCSFLYFYNYMVFKLHDTTHLNIIISIILIPLIINSILYSLLIFLDKKKEFLIVSVWNGFLYLLLTYLLIDFGTIGLIYSRLFTLILTISLTVFYVRNDVKIIFENYNLKFSFIKDSFFRFISVNNVLLFAVITRIYSSLFFENQMALVNYTMLITLTFYTIFSKNLNSQLIKNQILTSNLNNKTKLFYWSFSALFFVLLIFGFLYFPNKLFLFDNLLELKTPLKLSLFVFIPIAFLGYLDLLFQSYLSRQKKNSAIYFLPMILCLLFYHLIMVEFFV